MKYYNLPRCVGSCLIFLASCEWKPMCQWLDLRWEHVKMMNQWKPIFQITCSHLRSSFFTWVSNWKKPMEIIQSSWPRLDHDHMWRIETKAISPWWPQEPWRWWPWPHDYPTIRLSINMAYYPSIWRFPSMGVPANGWFINVYKGNS